MGKLQITEELLTNTTNIYLKEFLQEYIHNMIKLEQDQCKDERLIRLHNCISYIEKEHFDITGWMFFEIPIFYSHCFLNEQTKEQFDLVVWDIGEVIPRYIDSESNEQDARTIQEAINNYVTF